MNSNYVAEMQSTCIPNKQLVSGNMCPSTYMYPDTCCSSGTHVVGQHMSWYKRGFIVAHFGCTPRLRNDLLCVEWDVKLY